MTDKKKKFSALNVYIENSVLQSTIIINKTTENIIIGQRRISKLNKILANFQELFETLLRKNFANAAIDIRINILISFQIVMPFSNL